MPLYYVSNEPNEEGAHVVHRSTCGYIPSGKKQTFLGNYTDVHDAVEEAKKIYPVIDGCFYCCYAFHHKKVV